MSKPPNGRMHVFAAQFYPGRFHVTLDDHIVGVLTMGADGCRIVRVKLGRDEDGNNVYVAPQGNLSYLGRLYDTTTAAADAVLEHWLGRNGDAPADDRRAA
jgi:hypothetical protein